MGWATRRVNDGKGFMFISHVGNVYPSGFLPIHAGNIRETPLADIYRNAPIFKALRNTSRLEGKCGACEFKEICGGSAPAPTLSPAIRWPRNPAASTSPRTGTRSSTARPKPSATLPDASRTLVYAVNFEFERAISLLAPSYKSSSVHYELRVSHDAWSAVSR